MTGERESRRKPAPPPRSGMRPATVELHEAIDENIRRGRRPYLSGEGESVTVDLFGSAAVERWQERKSAATFLGASCWSELPMTYGRYGGESVRALVREVRALESARGAVVTESGMGAAAVLCDALLEPGDHVVAARGVYNKTKLYLAWLEKRIGIELSLVDDDRIHDVSEFFTGRTRLAFVETFTNPLMRALDPERLAVAARVGRERSPRLRLVVDDTIATPWGFRKPLLDVGVDFVVASGTKALDGRDRNLWGYVASNRLDELNGCMDVLAMRGGVLDERRAASVLEGLPLARERFGRRSRGAAEVARFLDERPEVAEVHHPSMPEHPDREVVDRCYALPGSIVSFRLAGADDEATRRFCDVLAMTGVVRYALSFDGLVSKVNHHRTVSEYFTAGAEVARLGVDRLVRFAMGLEAPEDVIECLAWALESYREIPTEEVRSFQRERARELGIDDEEA